MENIFTISKPNIEDDSIPESINIDNLYEKKRERDLAQLKIFNRMLVRVQKKIQITSRQRGGEKLCWFVVPEIMLGVPLYDQGSCIGYIMDKLKTDGFRVQYFHPNMLMISWDHWVPSYVIEEIKQKTGKVFDNYGNEMGAPDNNQYGYNNDPMQNQYNGSSEYQSGNTNVVFQKEDGVFRKSRKIDKKYTPIDEYKPKGSVVFDESLLFDMNKRKFT